MLVCYRDVLSDDLRAEGPDWVWTKKIAMGAATDKLQARSPCRMSDAPPSLTLDAIDQPLSSSLLSISQTTHTFESPGTLPLDTAVQCAFSFPDASGRAQASPMVAQPSTESEASTSVVHGTHKRFYTAPEPQGAGRGGEQDARGEAGVARVAATGLADLGAVWDAWAHGEQEHTDNADRARSTVSAQ